MPARTVPANPIRTRHAGAKAGSQSQPTAPSPKRENPQAPKSQPVQNRVPIQNRVRVLLVHIPRLSIQGQARLAAEVGVSRSTVSRLVHSRINPSYRLARGVTTALERFLGRPLDMRDVFSTDGTYLNPSGCALCGCGGCLPEEAWNENGTLKPEWRDARPGDWSRARPSEPPVYSGGSAGDRKESE